MLKWYWIGRATGINKVHEVAGSVGRVRYDVGDMEIGVEWYERDISGGEERRIFRSRVAADDAGPVVGKVYSFNSTELRMINVEMQLVPPVGGVTQPNPLLFTAILPVASQS